MAATLEEIREFHRRRKQEAAARAAEHSARLLQRLPGMVRLLKDHYGVRRVWLFGSLANGTATERSDIDLAVEGFTGPKFFQAIGELMALGGPVDLVCIEEASESLRHRIAAEGREL